MNNGIKTRKELFDDLKVDVLKQIYTENINKEQGNDLILYANHTINNSELLKDGEKYSLATIIGMNNYEYTAYCHGVDLRELAKWRYEDWPTKCYLCKKEIDYKEYYWTVMKGGKELVHVECPVSGIERFYVKIKRRIIRQIFK